MCLLIALECFIFIIIHTDLVLAQQIWVVLSVHKLFVPSFLVKIHCRPRGKPSQDWAGGTTCSASTRQVRIIMKIRNKFSNSLIQFTMLAQQICYTLIQYADSTLKGQGKKKRTFLKPSTFFSNNDMEIRQTTTNEN